MMELSEFLAKRLDEDEAVAKDVPTDLVGHDWTTREGAGYTGGRVFHVGGNTPWQFVALADSHDEAVAAHIARHDPARVLREVAAKRELLAQTAEMRNLASSTEAWFLLDMADNIERQLAVPYVEYSEFEPAWRVE